MTGASTMAKRWKSPAGVGMITAAGASPVACGARSSPDFMRSRLRLNPAKWFVRISACLDESPAIELTAVHGLPSGADAVEAPGTTSARARITTTSAAMFRARGNEGMANSGLLGNRAGLTHSTYPWILVIGGSPQNGRK